MGITMTKKTPTILSFKKLRWYASNIYINLKNTQHMNVLQSFKHDTFHNLRMSLCFLFCFVSFLFITILQIYGKRKKHYKTQYPTVENPTSEALHKKLTKLFRHSFVPNCREGSNCIFSKFPPPIAFNNDPHIL